MRSPLIRIEAAPDDPVVGWALQAFARARATKAPLLAFLAGVCALPDSTGTVALGFETRAGLQRPGIVEVAMLADFAAGGGLRARVGPHRPLPTLNLGIDLAARCADLTPELAAHVGSTAVAEDGTGSAACTLVGAGMTLGHCTATFSIPTRGHQDALPWDNAGSETTYAPLALSELTDVERELLQTVVDADRDPSGESWGDRLVSSATETDGAEPARARFTPSLAMGNRSGGVQGGVLFALAAQRGAVAAGEPLPRLVSGSMHFFATATTDDPVVVETSIEHATRRSTFTCVRILQEQQVRATAGLVYRRGIRP